MLPPPLALPSTLLSSLAAGLADRAQGNLLRLLSLLSLVNHFLPLFFRGCQTVAGAEQLVSSVEGSAVNEPGSIPGTKKVCHLACGKLSAALQRVSRAERLKSMAYKKRAVNPPFRRG
jgi:hypothetical protein